MNAPHLPIVVGLDLSCDQSGVALPDKTTVIKPPKPSGKRTLVDDLERLAYIEADVRHRLETYRPDLVVIEDYARGLKSASAHRLAEVGGVVRLVCWRAAAPVAIVNVQHLKIYATGKGGATKSQMATAAHKRAGLEFATEDECDAWWLQAMGLDYLGHPVCELPQLHRGALGKVSWPEVAP